MLIFAFSDYQSCYSYQDTSNITIGNLAVSKKNKSEVGAESLNALLSAPIVQNDTINASDIALVSCGS